MPSTSRPVSPATARNRQLRKALDEQFPDVKFLVRNGRAHGAAVSWTDGPSEDRVIDFLNTVRNDEGRSWLVTVTQTVTPELWAVAFMRERAAGRHRFYSERDSLTGKRIEPGDVRPLCDIRHQCLTQWSGLDGTAITPQEHMTAQAVLAVAGSLHPRTPHVSIARTIYHYGATIEAICQPAA